MAQALLLRGNEKMAWVRRQSETGNIDAYLIDGYLPPQEFLERRARSDSIRPYVHIPVSWEGHDVDSVYETVAFGLRGEFCACRPQGQRHSQWSEAWLLKPKRWGPEYELETPDQNESQRRLLMTLHSYCALGRECDRNLVKKSGFTVIPLSRYKNPDAFKAMATALLPSP